MKTITKLAFLISLTPIFYYLSPSLTSIYSNLYYRLDPLNKRIKNPIPAIEKSFLEFIIFKSTLPIQKSNSLEYLPYAEITEISPYLPSNKNNPEPIHTISDRLTLK